MSAKERDRLKILHEVKKRHITQKQAAAELGLSVRWVRALLVRRREPYSQVDVSLDTANSTAEPGRCAPFFRGLRSPTQAFLNTSRFNRTSGIA